MWQEWNVWAYIVSRQVVLYTYCIIVECRGIELALQHSSIRVGDAADFWYPSEVHWDVCHQETRKSEEEEDYKCQYLHQTHAGRLNI